MVFTLVRLIGRGAVSQYAVVLRCLGCEVAGSAYEAVDLLGLGSTFENLRALVFCL